VSLCDAHAKVDFEPDETKNTIFARQSEHVYAEKQRGLSDSVFSRLVRVSLRWRCKQENVPLTPVCFCHLFIIAGCWIGTCCTGASSAKVCAAIVVSVESRDCEDIMLILLELSYC
jgi:hypothetical protein